MRNKIQVTGFLIAAMAAGYVGGLMSQAKTQAVAQGPQAVNQASAIVTQDVVRAKRFVLVDSNNRQCGLFTCTANGAFVLLCDSEGKRRALFGINEGGAPSLALLDSASKQRASFAMDQNNDPALTLLDSASKPRGLFTIDKDQPSLVMKDSAGKVRGVFGTDHDYEPFLGMHDSAGDERIAITMNNSNPPRMLIFNPGSRGKIIWRAP